MIDEQIRDGDFVIVEDRRTADNGEMVIALLNGSDVTLKKLYREQGRIRPQPANPAMQPIIAQPDQVQVQALSSGPQAACDVRRATCISMPVARGRQHRIARTSDIDIARRTSHVARVTVPDERAQANQLHHRPGRQRRPDADLRELLRDLPHAVRLHARVLRSAPAVGKGHPGGRIRPRRAGAGPGEDRRAAQVVPNLIAALQEHMRVFSESTGATWDKGPVH